MEPSRIIYPDGSSKTVKNLGWLLRHWKEITAFHIEKHPDTREKGYQPDAVLIALLHDGRQYRTGFSCATVLNGFLDRSVFRGLFCHTEIDRAGEKLGVKVLFTIGKGGGIPEKGFKIAPLDDSNHLTCA